MDVIVISKSELKELLNEIKDEFRKSTEEQIIKHSYPPEIKGYQDVSRLINVPINTIKCRVQNGTYTPNVHYIRKDNTKHSDIHFYRDAIVAFEKSNKNGKIA